MLRILVSIMIGLTILFAGLSVAYVWAGPLAIGFGTTAIIFAWQDDWERELAFNE